MATLLTFEELECYRQARDVRMRISDLCRRLPSDETYRLRDQLLRASRSVTANIAEGFGRYHHQENAQFCRHARGSLMECLDHLNVVADEGFLAEAELVEVREMILSAGKVLNGYIAYLHRCAKQGVPQAREIAEPYLLQHKDIEPPGGANDNLTTQQPHNRNLCGTVRKDEPSNSTT